MKNSDRGGCTAIAIDFQSAVPADARTFRPCKFPRKGQLRVRPCARTKRYQPVAAGWKNPSNRTAQNALTFVPIIIKLQSEPDKEAIRRASTY